MSVDANAVLLIGWELKKEEFNKDKADCWCSDEVPDDKFNLIIGDKEDSSFPSSWVIKDTVYSEYPTYYIGYPLRISNSSLDTVSTMVNDKDRISKAKRVYEEICENPPDSDPTVQLFVQWW